MSVDELNTLSTLLVVFKVRKKQRVYLISFRGEIDCYFSCVVRHHEMPKGFSAAN